MRAYKDYIGTMEKENGSYCLGSHGSRVFPN